MKFIDDFMEKKAQDALKKENEHFERKARLSELESKNKQKGRNLLHPVKSANERKEIKNLRKEIAAYEKEKEDKKSILVLGGVLIGLLAVFILIGVFDKTPDKPVTDETTVSVTSDEPKNESTVQENTIAVTATTTDEQPNTASSIDNSIVAGAGASDANSEIVEQDEKVEQEMTEEEDEVEFSDVTTVRGVMVSDLSLKWELDYAHANRDAIILGNNEGITITIKADFAELEIEDLVFDYDTSLLNVEIEEPYHQDGKTIISTYVTANEECNEELLITTVNDLKASDGDMVNGFWLNITKLDSSEGKEVFVTPTGTKYHYDADCAGENAVKTTYYDVSMLEYEPCGTCVN